MASKVLKSIDLTCNIIIANTKFTNFEIDSFKIKLITYSNYNHFTFILHTQKTKDSMFKNLFKGRAFVFTFMLPSFSRILTYKQFVFIDVCDVRRFPS